MANAKNAWRAGWPWLLFAFLVAVGLFLLFFVSPVLAGMLVLLIFSAFALGSLANALFGVLFKKCAYPFGHQWPGHYWQKHPEAEAFLFLPLLEGEEALCAGLYSFSTTLVLLVGVVLLVGGDWLSSVFGNAWGIYGGLSLPAYACLLVLWLLLGEAVHLMFIDKPTAVKNFRKNFSALELRGGHRNSNPMKKGEPRPGKLRKKKRKR